MNDVKQKKENVKMHLKDLRQNLKKMHLAVTEELTLPKPDEVKTLMSKMDQLLKNRIKINSTLKSIEKSKNKKNGKNKKFFINNFFCNFIKFL